MAPHSNNARNTEVRATPPDLDRIPNSHHTSLNNTDGNGGETIAHVVGGPGSWVGAGLRLLEDAFRKQLDTLVGSKHAFSIDRTIPPGTLDAEHVRQPKLVDIHWDDDGTDIWPVGADVYGHAFGHVDGETRVFSDKGVLLGRVVKELETHTNRRTIRLRIDPKLQPAEKRPYFLDDKMDM